MNLCRVCMKNQESHIKLTQDYCKKFFHITEIEINDTDDEFLCDNCLNRLIAAWDFREEAKNADDWFKTQPDIIVKELSPIREFSSERGTSPVKESKDSVPQKIQVKRSKKSVKKKQKYLTESEESDNIKSDPESDPDFIPNEYPEPRARPERPEGPYECHFCSEQFTTFTNMKNHVLQHKREFRLNCKYCGIKQKDVKNRYSHERRHRLKESAKNMTYICDICGSSYTNRHKFSAHMLNHRVERKYKCTDFKWCQESFGQRRKFYIHLRDAHGITLRCDDCGINYSNHNSLRNHRRLEHNEDVKEIFKCPECPRKFLNKREMELHINAVHRGERNFHCLLCSNSYKTGSGLRRHYQTNHEDEYMELKKQGKLSFRTKKKKK